MYRCMKTPTHYMISVRIRSCTVHPFKDSLFDFASPLRSHCLGFEAQDRNTRHWSSFHKMDTSSCYRFF